MSSSSSSSSSSSNDLDPAQTTGSSSSGSLMDGLAALAADETVRLMTAILVTMIVVTLGTGQLLCTRTPKRENHGWLPNAVTHEYKRRYEIWCLAYGVFWVSCFSAIVGLEWYKSFDRWHYLLVCGGLAMPLLLQPIVAPCITKESHIHLFERYSFKANIWIAIFSFIGNYWYTHYFYSVLKASYTMPAHDINGVPVAMFFATHFYFSLYHGLSNLILRKIVTTYERGFGRTIYFTLALLTFAYFTAFGESISISGFPCYSFEDRFQAYTLGSAFYGIYFIVSYPMFLRLDTDDTFTVFQTAVESLASGMVVLCLLDFVRIAIGHGDFTYIADRPCKFDASLTCAPFTGTPC